SLPPSLSPPPSPPFFQSAHPPRYPPSFPTRRSSDLQLGHSAQRDRHVGCDRFATFSSRHCRPRQEGATRQTRSHGAQTDEPRCRSEEHTSELQSRFDLVCRLLLEKKNK